MHSTGPTRATDDSQRADAAGDRWLVRAAWGVVLAGLALRLYWFTPWDIAHPDELMQYVEQAHRLASGIGVIPWETRYGVRNALIPLLLAGPMRLAALLGWDGLAPVLAARAVYAAICALSMAAAWAIGAARSRRHAFVALVVAALWYQCALYGDHVLAESLATTLITGGVAVTLHARGRPGRWALAGLLFGLGVLVRVQYAVFVAVYVVAALAPEARKAGARALALGGGVAVAMALGAAIDLAMGQAPFAWVPRYVAMNITAGRAAHFGRSPPEYYIDALLFGFGALALPILAGAAWAGLRRGSQRDWRREFLPLLLAALANLAAHSMIAHKEVRFIWLTTFVVLILAALASLDTADRLLSRLPAPARVALPALLWITGSMLALGQTETLTHFRLGRPFAVSAWRAAQDPATCGIALGDHVRAHVVPAMLGRDLPLYIYPERGFDDRTPVPAAVTRAANAIVIAGAAPPPGGYARAACETTRGTTACVWQRPGGCEAAAGTAYTLQAALLREDM